MFLLLDRSRKIQATIGANQGKIVLAGLILIGIAFVYGSPSLTPWPMSLMPVTGTLLVIAGSFNTGSSSRALVCRFVRLQPLVWFGGISYALYLWHWPVLVFMRRTIGHDDCGWFALLFLLVCLWRAFLHIYWSGPLLSG